MKFRYKMCHIICTSALFIAGCQTDLTTFDSYKPSANDTTVDQTKPDLKALPNPEKKSAIDNKIFSEMILLDENQIVIANLGKEKSKNPKVIAFAEYLAKHHATHLKKTINLSHQMNITPEQSHRCRSLEHQVEREMKQLERCNSNNFDKAFINTIIQNHRHELSILNDNLRKVSHPMLKAHLMAMYQIIESYLHRAEQLKQQEA